MQHYKNTERLSLAAWLSVFCLAWLYAATLRRATLLYTAAPTMVWIRRISVVASLALTATHASTNRQGLPAAMEALHAERSPSGPPVMDAVLFRTHFVDGILEIFPLLLCCSLSYLW